MRQLPLKVRALNAFEAAEQTFESLNSIGEFLLRQEATNPFILGGCGDVVRAAREGALNGDPVDITSAMIASMELIFPKGGGGGMIGGCVNDIARAALWQHSKIIHVIDSTLWDELRRTEEAEKIPVDVFRNLPLPDPYIHFPTPVATGDGSVVEQCTGFFISGLRPVGSAGNVTYCSTHDPDVFKYRLTFCARVLDLNSAKQVTTEGLPGMKPIPSWTYTFQDIPLHGVGMTVGSLLPNADGTGFLYGSGTQVEGIDAIEFARESTRAVLGVLLYLCSEKPEIEKKRLPPKAVASKAKKAGKRRKPSLFAATETHEVGFTIGSELRASRDRDREPASTGDGDSAGKGQRTVRPHIRRAHFHTFRHGVGRRKTKVRWVAPTPVNVDDGNPGRAIVRPVR